MRTKNQLFPLFVLALTYVVCPGDTSADQASTGPGSGTVAVEFDTSEGKFVIELDADKAPMTVDNFLMYVESGHYEGTVFHRVIKNFMIQGGGMDSSHKEKKTRPPVKNEAGNGLANERYTVAMARTNDPHSATSQFFVNTNPKGNSFLNRAEARDGFGYTVFGKVVQGTEVIDKIGNTRTQTVPDPNNPGRLMQDVPVTPIVVKSVKVLKGAQN